MFASPPRTIEEGLIRARDEIVRHGWTQGQARDRRGRICAQEAIHRGCRADFVRSQQVMKALSVVIQAQYGMTYATIPSWNDSNNRTYQQVLDMFDRAIATVQDRPTITVTASWLPLSTATTLGDAAAVVAEEEVAEEVAEKKELVGV